MATTDGADVAHRASDTITRAMNELTPGQRWTSGLMVGLAIVVLLFGLPDATRTVIPAAATGTAEVDDPPAVVADAPSVPPLTDTLVRPPAPVAEVVSGDGPSAPEAAEAPTTMTPPTPFSLAAIFDPASGFGDRTDEAMARRFVSAAGLDATFVPLGEPEATCAAARTSTLVVTGGALPLELQSCLVRAGVTTVGFNDDAVLGPLGGSVSTRRGVVRSLFDTAAQPGLALDGPLGLVADERLRPSVEPALPLARAAGLDIITVTWLAPGEPPASVAISLAGEGLSGVLFATSVQNQASIGSQLRTVSPATQLVVLDAADSLVSASYPPLFDGATAVTSVQLPWHPGAEAQRTACRDTWESEQTPPAVVDGAELLRALTWCQHSAIADALRSRWGTGVASALAGLEVTSPITAPLARLLDGGFGPTLVTTATWSAACGCWSSSAAFAPSGSDHG